MLTLYCSLLTVFHSITDILYCVLYTQQCDELVAMTVNVMRRSSDDEIFMHSFGINLIT